MSSKAKKKVSSRKSKRNKLPKDRDFNMLLAAKGEINLSTKCTTPNKKAYNKKKKHKNKSYD